MDEQDRKQEAQAAQDDPELLITLNAIGEVEALLRNARSAAVAAARNGDTEARLDIEHWVCAARTSLQQIFEEV